MWWARWSFVVLVRWTSCCVDATFVERHRSESRVCFLVHCIYIICIQVDSISNIAGHVIG